MNSKEAALYSKTRGFQVATYRLYVPDFEIKADDKILDVGCGTGDLAYEFGDVAQSVIGFDISKEMINFARHSYKRPNVTYELADVLSCVDIFPDWKGAFDKVVSIHVLHWVKDRKGAFQSIHDCLKPGGECFLLISGPMNQIMGHGDDELPHYLKNHDKWKEHLKGYENKFYNRLTLEDNVKLLESVGFEVVKGHSYKPCDELDIDKDQIKDYLQTLLGHLSYLPEQYRDKFLDDATDWCKQNFPVNQRGNAYFKIEIIMLHAKKTKKE